MKDLINEFKAAKAAAIVSRDRRYWIVAVAAYIKLRKEVLNMN